MPRERGRPQVADAGRAIREIPRNVPDMREQVSALLSENRGVIRVSRAGELANSVRWLARTGELAIVRPGVLAAADRATRHLIRARALQAVCPDAVLTGASAAAALGWGKEPEMVTAAVPTKLKSSRGFALTRQRIEPEWIATIDDLRVTNQFMTVVDLIPERGGQVIDDLLRRHPRNGTWVLQQLWSAHRARPRRPGNGRRAELLADSADRPWSEAERAAHRLLRRAGIGGWQTNHPVQVDGRRFFLDIAFPRIKVAIEINGFERHGQRAVFEEDHLRRNALVLDGWRVLEFTWCGVTERSEQFIAEVLTVTLGV